MKRHAGQRELFAVNGQESLFEDSEKDLLEDIARQASEDDVVALRELLKP